MVVIHTTNGVDIRIPVSEIESMIEVEPASGTERAVPTHPYLHREGANRCAASRRERTHPSHSDVAVHGR
jgi:hypothetical protein